MKRALLLLASLAFTACTAPAEPTATTASAMPAPQSEKQFFPFVPRAVIDARIAEFRGRNGMDWKLTDEVAANEMLTPALGARMTRLVAAGATLSLTHAERVERVRAFVQKNADLLGIAAPADAHVSLASGDLFSVDDGGPQPLGVETGYRFFVGVGRDGEVSSVAQVGRRFPRVDLDPSDDFDRDLVERRLLGVELKLAGHPSRFVSESDFADPYWAYVHARETRSATGVTLTRVASLSVGFAPELDPCSIPFTTWSLTVDAGTGEVLDGTETECISW